MVFLTTMMVPDISGRIEQVELEGRDPKQVVAHLLDGLNVVSENQIHWISAVVES
jgi:hypothetical protein